MDFICSFFIPIFGLRSFKIFQSDKLVEMINEAEDDKNTNFSHFIPSKELTELTWILIIWDTIIQGIGQPAGYDRISNWKCKNWYFHSEVSFTFGFPTPIWTFFLGLRVRHEFFRTIKLKPLRPMVRGNNLKPKGQVVPCDGDVPLSQTSVL